MRLVYSRHELFLFCSFFLIVLSNSIYLNSIGKNTIVEYLGYLLLLIEIYHGFLTKASIRNKPRKMIIFCIIFILFNIGIIVQDLPIKKRIVLILSMFILESFMALGEGVVTKRKDIQMISDAIIWGCISCLLIAILTRSAVIIGDFGVGDGFPGFASGMMHKNFFGATILVGFSGLYLCRLVGLKHKYDIMLIMAGLCMIFLSGSRGTWMLALILIVISNIYRISIVKKHQRIVLAWIAGTSLVIIAYIVFKNWALNSINYMYRIRGLVNYLNIYHGDTFHMFFGNAEMAYQEGMDYNTNIRSVIGWDGTTEMAILNILIKNGMIGTFGYFLIFITVIRDTFKIRKKEYRWFSTGLISTMIISMLVESYLVNLQFVFSAVSFAMIGGICYIDKMENVRKGYDDVYKKFNGREEK